MIEFETYVKNESTLSTSEINQYLGIFQEVKFNKGEFFATEGEYSKKIAFLISGVMRAFFRDINGKEYNKTLFTKLNFVAPFSSLITGNRNLINIQCLTPCNLAIAEYSRMTDLYDSIPNLERFARKLVEQIFVSKERREIEIVMLSAAERYELFKKKFPELEKSIPQYHIASYLGISPTQLSRIRGNY